MTSSPQVDAPPKIFVAPNPLPAKSDWAWTTRDGKTYSNVVIIKVEADSVTILDKDGGARIDISNLPGELQQQLNYDPDLASTAAAERSKSDQESAASMENERAMGAQVQQDHLAQLGVQQEAMSSDSLNPSQGQSNPAVSNSSYSTVYYGDYYPNDLIEIRRHLRLNPQTGRYEGSAEDMARYERDNKAIEEQKRFRSENPAAPEANRYVHPGSAIPAPGGASRSWSQGSPNSNGMPSNETGGYHSVVPAPRPEPTRAPVVSAPAPRPVAPPPPPQPPPSKS